MQDNGCMQPAGNLYHHISKETWKYAGILIASSMCMNGPAPNIFAPWVYKYITDGSAGVWKKFQKNCLVQQQLYILQFLYTFLKFSALFSSSNVMRFTLAGF